MADRATAGQPGVVPARPVYPGGLAAGQDPVAAEAGRIAGVMDQAEAAELARQVAGGLRGLPGGPAGDGQQEAS